VRPSSTYCSTVVVTKKNGSHRVCVYYRQFNKIICDQFPIDVTEDCIDALALARVFSVFDLKNGFFHVPVAEDSKYTSFVTTVNTNSRRPHLVCVTAQQAFLRFVDEVFWDLSRQSVVLTYIDDLIVPGRNEAEAFDRRKTLATAAEKGLAINWKKCKFLERKVEYLGHIIGDGCVRPSNEKIKAVQKFLSAKEISKVFSD